MEINQKYIDHIKKYGLKYLLIIFVAVLFIKPIGGVTLTSGHDALFHTSRINNIAANINNGKWFSPIYHGHNNGYGYAAPLFYGDTLLHIPALFKVWGMKTEMTLRIFLMFCTSATAAASYYAAKRIFKRDDSAFVTSVIYTFSSYYIIDAIERVAVGETQAFIFLPLVVLGYYSIMFDDKRYWLWLPAGLFGVLISHSLSAVIAVIIMTAVTLIFVLKYIGDRKKILYLLASAAVFFIIAASFIFPYIEQTSHNDFRFNDGTAEVANGTLEQRATPLYKVFSDFVFFNARKDGEKWVPNGMGSVFFIAIALCSFIKLQKGKVKNSFLLITATLLTLLATSDLFPWGKFQNLFGILQFPWRLLLFSTLFISLAGGALIKEAASKSWQKNVFVFFLVCGALFSYFMGGSNTYNLMKNRSDNPKYNSIYESVMYSVGSGQEYLPSGSDYAKYGQRGQKVTSNDETVEKSISFTRNYDNIEAFFSGNTGENNYLEFPYIMYKGYTAFTETGKILEVTYGENNVVRVYLDDSESGKVTVGYKPTTIQTISKIISCTGFIAVIAYTVLSINNRRKIKIEPAEADLSLQTE